jgi:small GTP-binding protein
VQITHDDVSFRLWDTAGQERYRAIAPLYVRESSIELVLFDWASEPSFRSVREWVEVACDSDPNIPIVLIGSKTDLEGSVPVRSHDDAKSVAKELALSEYIALSSISGFGIDGLLEVLRKLLTKDAIPETVTAHPVREAPHCC